MNNFQTRAVTGIVFVAVLSFCTLYNELSFLFLFALVVFLSLREFYTLVLPEDSSFHKIFSAILGTLIYLTGAAYAQGLMEKNVLIFLVPALFTPFILELFFSYDKPFNNIAQILTGWVYIPAPCVMLHFLSRLDDFTFEPWVPMSVFLLIWTNDTFAYLVGKNIGRTPLFPRISPKKTIEGTLGGALFVLILSALMPILLPDVLTLPQWMVIGIIISIAATVGDLIESQLKRSAHIKDTGNLLPGHGGLLDRFDAMFLAAPAAYFYLYLVI